MLSLTVTDYKTNNKNKIKVIVLNKKPNKNKTQLKINN